MGFYSVNTLLQDAQRHGIRIRPNSCLRCLERAAGNRPPARRLVPSRAAFAPGAYPGPHAIPVTIAGMTICRQRPGTANLFIPKTTFHRLRDVITSEPFLQVEGILQRSEGDQPTVYVLHIEPLSGIDPEHTARSHDFH